MTQDIASLLEISYYLAFINYVLGSLLLGAPLPFSSLKRLGASMMKDAVTGLVMITGFGVILYIVRFIQGLLASRPEDLEAWFTSQTLSIAEKLALLKSIALATGPLIRSVVDPLISSATSILSAAFTSLFLLRILYILVFQKGAVLLALGILLYNIPLGIFKRAGSMLISFIVISLIALPAIPSFVNFLLSSTGGPPSSGETLYPQETVAYPVIVFRDYSGYNLSYVYSRFYLAENPGQVIAAYLADRSGVIDTRSLGSGLPVLKKIGYRVELYGWVFYNDETIYLSRDCVYSTCRLEIKVPGILVSEMPYIYIHTPPHLIAYNYSKSLGEGRGYIEVNVLLEQRDTLYITAPSTTNITLVEVNGVETIPEKIAWTWGGLEGYSYKVSLESLYASIKIYYVFSEPRPPVLDIVRYVPETGIDIHIDQFLSDAIYTLIVTTIFPTIYLSLILMGSNSLSRLLTYGKR